MSRTRCRSSSLLVGIEGGVHLRNANQEEEKYLDLEDGTIISNSIKMKSSGRDMGDPILSPGCYQSGVSLSLQRSKQDKCVPHALRRLKPSRFSYCCLYSFVLVGYWVLSLAIPYYAWIATVLGSTFLFRFVGLRIFIFILFCLTRESSKKRIFL